jgi:hypothetical protein
MHTQSDLHEAERGLYLSYFDDGVADVLAGLPVILFGLGMIFDTPIFFILTFLPITIYLPLKQAIMRPRTGYVKFTLERRQKISSGMILMMMAGTLTFLLGIGAFLGFEGLVLGIKTLMLEYSLLVIGAVMAAPYVMISILFGLKRFAGYAALILMGWVAAYYLVPFEGLPIAAVGGMISLIGLIILVRFLSRVPRLEA